MFLNVKTFAKKQQRCLGYEQAQKNSTLAPSRAFKNLSHIICFNSDKNGHYAIKCLKPKKNRATSKN